MKRIQFILSISNIIVMNCLAQVKPADVNFYQMSPIHIYSRWAKEVTPTNSLIEYPRPQLQRKYWLNLNGLWEYTVTDSTIEMPSSFQGKILVPFPIESALSGVQRNLTPDSCLWYKKVIQRPITKENEHVLLHFDAIDWKATVFINDKIVGQHTGGYQKFSLDVTKYLKPGNNEILVKVFDPSDQGPNPHGKQVLNPSNIYYTPSSGIWQTVWLETVPSTYINNIKSTPDIDKGTLALDINTIGKIENTKLEIVALHNGKKIYSNRIKVTQNHENTIISINDIRLWSPDDPFLYDLSIKLIKGGKTIDEIKSYFGMRKIDIQKDEKGADRIFLNNKYTYNLGVLDQGYWPEGLYTAPTDEALAFDIRAIKSLGFNTIRKHIKIEPDRWYYHADRIGILVWQDFVNPPQNLPSGSKEIFEKEAQQTMEQLHNHPSIINWVLFNERWGAYDQERLTKWVKKSDPSRIVNGHSGELLYVDDVLRMPADSPWISSDMTDVHSYPEPRNSPAQRDKARVVGEFGGIGVSVPGHEWNDMQAWGYVQVTANEMRAKYANMMIEIKKLEKEGLSASIYTQPFDVEGEENGILTYDREIIKIPANEIREINQKMISQGKISPLDPNFVIASDMNVNDNDNRYDELLAEYKNGNRDSALLRRLILISIRKENQGKITEIGNDYIGILKDPLSKKNLTFILAITKTSKDKGFGFFRKYPEKIDSMLGENTAALKVKSIIYSEEIAPYKSDNPDWETIQQKVVAKYGDIGEELVLGRRMSYYGFEAKKKDWENYSKYYVLYFQKALTHPEWDINGLTWSLYLNVNDPKVLEFAASVMKYAIDKWDKSAEAYDTYANILHKLNKSSEAIKWEEKALQIGRGSINEKILAETLQKMKAGLPTWPQNN